MTEDRDAETSVERPLRERLVALAILIGCVAALLAMAAGYAWIARRSFAVSTVAGGLAGLFSIGMFGALTRRRVKVDSIPEPLNGMVVAALEADSPKKVVLRRGTGGAIGSFPRPIVNGPSIVVPDRVLRDWSSGAILWSVRTDCAVGRRFVRRSCPVLVVAMLLVLFGMALLERWRLASGGCLLIPFLAIMGVFTLAAFDYYRLEKIEDRRITRTSEDLSHAREALLYPYLAQRERPTLNKWMFASWELRGRARNLGIDLDAEATDAGAQAASRA